MSHATQETPENQGEVCRYLFEVGQKNIVSLIYGNQFNALST